MELLLCREGEKVLRGVVIVEREELLSRLRRVVSVDLRVTEGRVTVVRVLLLLLLNEPRPCTVVLRSRLGVRC